MGGARTAYSFGAEDGRAMVTGGASKDGHVLDHAENLVIGKIFFPWDQGRRFGLGRWEFQAWLTGTLTLRNMLTPFIASLRAMSCGVEIMTAPES